MAARYEVRAAVDPRGGPGWIVWDRNDDVVVGSWSILESAAVLAADALNGDGDQAALTLAAHVMIESTELVNPVESTITCPRCGHTSDHPLDIEYGWCAACQDYTAVAVPVPTR